MKYFIIFFERNISWAEFYEPTAHKLVLINTPRDISALKNRDDDRFFEKIYEISNIKKESILPAMEDFFKTVYKDPQPNHGNIRIATSHEDGLLLCAEIRKEYNIPGDTLKQLKPYRNKLIMKESIPSQLLPKYMRFIPNEYAIDPIKYYSKIETELGYPIFAKPIMMSSSIDCTKIENLAQLIKWCEQHHDRDDMELDEFLDGTLHHVDCLHKDGKILDRRVGSCLTSPWLENKPRNVGSIVLPTEHDDYNEMIKFNAQILENMPFIPDGANHHEFIKLENGKGFRFVEIAARPAGAGVPENFQVHCGLHYPALHFKLQLGLPINLGIFSGPFTAFILVPPQIGTLVELFEPNFHSQQNITWNYKIGDTIKEYNHFQPFLAKIFLTNENYSQLNEDFFNRSAQHIFCRVDN